MTESRSNLILPGDPEFDQTLGLTLPPDWQVVASSSPEFSLVARVDQGGVLSAVPWEEAQEYIEGGEYDERLEEFEDPDLLEEWELCGEA
ncbi:hypothetical protein H6F90_08170 [Trichocoleus sp. FACHB-591]|uniref:hypothetical protein n=1 Tax=Trichocoleus sp. FACHB-591 TaxID=2692872 RepID=UPI00168358EB|nr:hypothetical protein [Trichocoleus sp. FACHB-591]MBD2095129.1 hypothetical protein [Trichocoleus sp. FACHB-591]